MMTKNANVILSTLKGLNNMQAGVLPIGQSTGMATGMGAAVARDTIDYPTGGITASDRMRGTPAEMARVVGLGGIVSPQADWSAVDPYKHRYTPEVDSLNDELTQLIGEVQAGKVSEEQWKERIQHWARKAGMPEYMNANPEYAAKAAEAVAANHLRMMRERDPSDKTPIPQLGLREMVEGGRQIYAPNNPITSPYKTKFMGMNVRPGEITRGLMQAPGFLSVTDPGAPKEKETLGEKTRDTLGLPAAVVALVGGNTIRNRPPYEGPTTGVMGRLKKTQHGVADKWKATRNALAMAKGPAAQGLWSAGKVVSTANAMTDPDRRAEIAKHEKIMRERWGADENSINNVMYQAGRVGRAGFELLPFTPTIKMRGLRPQFGVKPNPLASTYWTGTSATKGLANSVMSAIKGDDPIKDQQAREAAQLIKDKETLIPRGK